ncbi:MAG TPA: ATP-binding protein [Verrucomicrobiota bacterium]|nr:ATP-binding protein [Verrucomicrobiota bacterium]
MKSEQVFVLDHANWPALLVDGGGRVVRANAAALQAFAPSLEGDRPMLAAIWSPENGATVEPFLAQWEQSPSPALTLKFRVKGGNVAAFTTTICALTQGAEKYFVLQLLPEPSQSPGQKGNGTDAGSIQKQKLDCALQLARSVALDFNNALTSILGHTSHLLSQSEANHPWRKSLLEVEKSAAKAAEIANDLASFSRQDREPRGQTAGNLNSILQRCADSFQSSHKDAAKWQLQFERRLFSAKFDEAKVQQAFVKVMENAIESLQGDGRVCIQTRNVQLNEPTQDRDAKLAAGSYVCVEISDNGGGIAPEVLPRIFEPFFTTKQKNHRGLGLAWVYGIVTNHGGGVAVSSRPGAGTSVRIYLPAEEKVVRDHGDYAGDLKGTETILMVDDEDLLLTMGETVLTSYGYKVLTANTGQKALDIVSKSQTHIDLVITDLVMPVMSGRELIEQVRKLSPSTHIMCSSGYSWPTNQHDAPSYLQKPFTSQELLMRVKQALRTPAPQVD